MLFHIKHALKGKTLARSLMNHALSNIRLSGKVLDLGGGGNPSYLTYFKKDDDYVRKIIDIDKKRRDAIDIDLETARIPFEDGSMDMVLMLNLLEHIYSYKHVLTESQRVLRPRGEVIGFVPFLINVHRDPHDFFRYTDEALEKMLKDAGFSSISVTPLGYGPFCVSYNTLVSVLPTIAVFWLLPISFLLDRIVAVFRPRLHERFPLGYLFTARK